MPRSGFKQAAGVDVELERPENVFLPGDTINGNVLVKAGNSLSGIANQVHIKVFGRCKVLIVESHGEGQDYFRGRASLFEKSFFLEGPPVSQTDGREAWRFSVQIPTHTVPAEYKPKINDTWKKASKYLDNTEMDVSTHPLPGVFYYCGESGGTKGQSYVEYVLEASLHSSQGPEDEKNNKKKKKKLQEAPTTIIPLVVRVRSTERPIQYSEYMQNSNQDIRVKSLRLLPQFATEQLGFRHNLKSVFQSSKIPNYFFDLKVSCPSTIQLDNPSAFPFKLSIIPKIESGGKGSTSNGNVGDDESEEDDEVGREHGETPRLCDRTGVATAYGWNLMNKDDSLDLGQLLNLHVSRTHSTRLDNERTDFKTKRPLWPSFKTYNISCHYEWKYKFTIMCAGETQVVEGKQRVELISQSEEQEQNIAVDRQGVRKKWKELMEGAEGIGEVLLVAGEVASEV
ncbi:hypothetical protein ABW20_dc0102056 [Dactylellina cionopaga]|nr:hypothetical protein ABW20_dc0102056 [Dactylellina cionopaga]